MMAERFTLYVNASIAIATEICLRRTDSAQTSPPKLGGENPHYRWTPTRLLGPPKPGPPKPGHISKCL